MDKLTGKTIIFTDMHCGLAGNKVSRLNICVMVVKELLLSIKANGIKNVIFAGDWFHNRNTLDLNTINVSIKLIQALAKFCKCYLIVGNHDAYLKNSTDINSLNIFRNTKNIVVLEKASEIELNGQKCVMVPWLSDLTKYQPDTFDIAVGHFEVSSKYLIQSYVEEHSARSGASKKISGAIDSDALLSDGSSSKAGSLIGAFTDIVKNNGYIYSGHIHTHKEFKVRNRNFIFIGSPYEQNLGDIGNERGYYILDERNVPRFIRIDSVPKHVQVKMSEAIREGYDFKPIRGNIVQKIYDIDVKQGDEASVTQKITDNSPYEELIPDYQVKPDFSCGAENSSLDSIKKSKIDYLKNYIGNIEQKVLDELSLDREKLFEILHDYYRIITEK